jgi:predicted transcriptional regulator
MGRSGKPDGLFSLGVRLRAKSMIHFWQKHGNETNGIERQITLGSLEIQVMAILWTQGESNVHDVVEKLDRKLAYTTVMTTLDRLFKKGLLERHKQERAFAYSPCLSRAEWEKKRAEHLVAGFLAGPQQSRELLISCLLDAVSEHDKVLLDELEEKVRMKRKELFGREQGQGPGQGTVQGKRE